MKKGDDKIISHLRSNARISLTKLSRETGIPVSTIFERIKMHEKEIIVKHTALLDFFKMGYSTRANITIKIDKKRRDDAAKYLRTHQNVNNVYKITNGYDFLIEGVFKNLLDLENFNEDLEDRFKVKNKQVYFVIQDIKREGFMAEPNLI